LAKVGDLTTRPLRLELLLDSLEDVLEHQVLDDDGALRFDDLRDGLRVGLRIECRERFEHRGFPLGFAEAPPLLPAWIWRSMSSVAVSSARSPSKMSGFHVIN